MILWLRRNLFRSIWDSITTIVFGGIALWFIWISIEFVFITGRWEIVEVNLKLFLVGRFPEELMWLIGASMVAIAFWVAAVAGGSPLGTEPRLRLGERIVDYVRRFGLIFALAILLVVLSNSMESLLWLGLIGVGVIAGRVVGRMRRDNKIIQKLPGIIWQPMIATPAIALVIFTLLESTLELWGGFLINFYMALISIILCFPLGLLLALGRRSSFPVIRVVCTTYIELIRGAPLFVLLLLAGVALEFFIPPTISPDAVFRGITVFTLFTAAYLAEIVRGGLQGIPSGQIEAGKALGLSTVKINSLITLPQALRSVIPAQIGQFISLFKDTTLAGVALNLFDVMTVGKVITKQDDFLGQGLIYESLIFVGLLFWVVSYVMSKESQRLEKRLGVGIR
ncbi:MAG TPA: amino acid ABC transporter permease [Aquiluna sp.]